MARGTQVTGMANAYSVSAVTKRGLRLESKAESKDSGSGRREAKTDDGEDAEASVVSASSGRVVIKTLANGEKRMCVELKERVRREAILRRYGLIDDKAPKESGDKKEADDDPYAENDFDEYGDDQDDEQKAPGKGGSGKKNLDDICGFSSWTNEDRKKGLKYLTDKSKDARQEAILKAMLSEGTPPRAPLFWCNAGADSDEGDTGN